MAAKARDIMTAEVITVTPNTPLRELARVFADDGISGAPVVTMDGRLIGLVSRTDLVERILEGAIHPAGGDLRDVFGMGEDLLADLPAGEAAAEREGFVDDIMTAEVIGVPPGAPLAHVAEVMSRERIHRVTVVDDDHLCGIITSLDLLRHWGE